MMNDETESNDLENQTEGVVEETTKALPETEETEESGDVAATSETDESDEQESKPKAKGYKGKWLRTQAELQKLALEVEMLKGANKPAEKPAEKLDKPKRDDFDSVEAYEDARDAYVEARLLNKLKAEQEKAKQTQTVQGKLQAHNERLNSFVKETKDFNDVVESFIEEHGDIQFSKDLNDLILESELGPEIIYELVKDKKLLDQLNSYSQFSFVAKNIGKLEDKILAKKTTTTKTTKASAPITPLKGGSATVKKDIYDPSLSYSDWEKLMNERDKQRKRA